MPYTTTFAYKVEKDRKYDILTRQPSRAKYLLYQYQDTKEIVIIPNYDYKISPQDAVQAKQDEAVTLYDRADRIEKYNPDSLAPELKAEMIAYLQGQAEVALVEAKRMEVENAY